MIDFFHSCLSFEQEFCIDPPKTKQNSSIQTQHLSIFQAIHTAVKTQNSRIYSVFALIALIELVRLVLWVENGVMWQKNCFL